MEEKYILIVDDNVGCRKSFKLIIEDDDDVKCKVMEAQRADEAIRLVAEKAHLLVAIIMDINLSEHEKDGKYAIKKIKEIEYAKHIPIIVFTADPSQDTVFDVIANNKTESYILKVDLTCDKSSDIGLKKLLRKIKELCAETKLKN